ncbi:MAG: ATP-dependent helicase DinG [Actinomycetota bacterium]|nr:ATP-dependent helicase DinG [Actinomycetota bacterium]
MSESQSAKPKLGLGDTHESQQGSGAGGPDSTAPSTAPNAELDVSVKELLDVVVAGLSGEDRPGQQSMVQCVARAMSTKSKALIQAGTGTGKSIGYLVPAISHVQSGGGRVIVATATLALQHQLVNRDLPAIAGAIDAAGRAPLAFAVLKGRANYVCKQRLQDPLGDGEQLELEPVSARVAGRLESDAARLREWAETSTTGDRDELDEIDARVWRAYSVNARECIGASACPFGGECFAERARAVAAEADIVVTNHAMLALDALENVPVLPEHDTVVVDEGHELADRATAAVTTELSAGQVSRLPAGARRLLDSDTIDMLESAGTALAEQLFSCEGRITALPDGLRSALAGVRDATHRGLTEIGSAKDADPDATARRQRVRTALEDTHDVAGQMLATGDEDVLWVDRGGGSRPPTIRLAPMSVAGPLREGLMADRAVILTSATLSLGGDFAHVARSVGLSVDDRDGQGPLAWTALDVGSPFSFDTQGILYLAADLPRPGRDGPSQASLDTLAELVSAAGGRTLALFSSWRGVDAAAERLADCEDVSLLVQQRGDAVGSLVRRFADEPSSVLVGTLSLWQGVDVPGNSCILVVIDKIPFPRPDDPMIQARAERVERHGGNGFTAVSVPRAGLLLAQGVGRLIRTSNDRGVVAILDPRMTTAGYGSFLVRSLPPFWITRDKESVLGSLARLAADITTTSRSDPP